MNDRQWEKFFDLLSIVVNDLPGTAEEKKQQVLDRAKEEGYEGDLLEFVAWNWPQ